MKSKIVVLLLVIALSACAPAMIPVSTSSTLLPTTSETPSPMSVMFTKTLPPFPTPSPHATLPTLTPTLTPTATPTLLPLPAMPSKFPLNGYVMLFAKDGDLYFQDGENISIKLTYVGGGQASSQKAILSDDGEKIVFFRESNYKDIYSINADGSHEQLLVKDRPLAEYTGAYSRFIPNTHILLFNTYQCETQGNTTLCATGVYSVDTDTAEIKELVKPDKVGLYTTISNFSVSPDGKLIAVAYPGYIDILDINGQAIRRNVIPYTPDLPSINGLSLLPSIFWLPDSSGLTVIVPDGVAFVAGFNMPAYSVWRYDINSAASTQISLVPSLVDTPVATCGGFDVSPDGNWILYYGSEDYTHDPFDGTYSLYIRDLRNGQMQRYDMLYCWGPSWSPDSRHFFYGNKLGAIDESSVGIKSPIPLEWLDDLHFIFPDGNPKPSETKMLVGEIRGDTVVFFDSGIPFFDLVMIQLKR